MRINYSFEGNHSTVDIGLARVVIGRPKPGLAVDVDLSPDKTVSRPHAVLYGEAGQIFIEDLDSTLGTQVNGHEIKGDGPRLIRPGDVVRIGFWVFGAVFVQLRLLANLYDGMVAVLREVASPVGELFNEVPDRVSDAATLIGFGYAAGSNPVLGFVATIFAIFLAYLRAQGKVAGAHQEFCGPMAKQQRMATVTIAAIACAVVPGATDWQIPMFALWMIIAGCIMTIVRRLQRITTTLRRW